MEQATILDLLQLVGVLLKVFALVVLAVTLAITVGVVVYVAMQSIWARAFQPRRPVPLHLGSAI